ncbi:hypothetical protein DPMN_166323 [Dreissena polymorpha]|uniref:Uncharacterized protein n=1 Tax=Dreissena polymorpha TaxID=45954 RepID=A0A9D4F209_DREPO|nr:hypothetical protein DPMN_166323 [Dreissena polymorpha]
MQRISPSTLSWGTPLTIGVGSEISLCSVCQEGSDPFQGLAAYAVVVQLGQQTLV